MANKVTAALELAKYMQRRAKREYGGSWKYANLVLTSGTRTLVCEPLYVGSYMTPAGCQLVEKEQANG